MRLDKAETEVAEKINRIDNAILTELDKAIGVFPKFVNAHEGFAVLMEEVDELWDVVKLNQKNPERELLLKKEGIQVAAMAIRFLLDVCEI